MTTVSNDPRSADVLLSDGALAVVRRVRPDDGPALYELHDRVSDDTVWLRFFSVSRETGRQYVDKVLSSTETIALVAEVDGRVAALATAEPTAPEVCEVAFLVADDHRGRGLGTLLLEHLAADARDRGVAQLEARVLRANHRMLQVFEDAGFELDRHLDDGEVVLRMRTVVTSAIQTAADEREFAAERRSLTPLLAPRGVVVYGARRDGTGIGGSVLAAIAEGGYRGSLAVVHPSCPRIRDVSAHPSASDSGVVLDLAVIAVPAESVVAALEDAAAAGVRAAVVISSGFREMGERGASLQHELVTCARRHGIRLVGPNGLGMISNDPDVRLHATFGGLVPAPGGLAMASQSGGVGIALMDLLAKAGVGLRHFVSLGNKADVSGNDLLAAWYDDERVTCAALYLESFGNARKFARFARTFSERKPLVAVVGGRSVGGRRAGSSHTAAAASPAAGVRALFAQAGVIACQDAEELADTTVLLTRAPLPAGNRVAIISNAGGMGVLAADLAADEQLEVVEFSSGLRGNVSRLVNQTTGTANPVDAGAGADPEQIAAIVSAAMSSGEVDAVVVVLVATGTNDLCAATEALASVHRTHPGTPMLVVPLGGPALVGNDIAVFGSSAGAIGALGRVVRYAGWRRIARQEPELSDPAMARRARTDARGLLDSGTANGWVRADGARELLGSYGIDLVGQLATGPAAAAAVAKDVGFPVAVKLGDADVVHKTDLGLVRTGLRTGAEVEAAVEDFERVQGHPCAVLVQPMVAGVELAFGVVRDASFGPLVMIAAGGVAVDALDDRAFLLPPFHDSDAMRVLRSLRIWPLLDGFRGAAPAATWDAARLAARLGRLAVDVPELAEVDLNPVMVGPQSCAVVDAKVRLAPAPDTATDLPRQLRKV